jgi:uncharacterized protein YuzE
VKLNYYPDTDTLYIDLCDEPATETEEIAYNVLVDYNAEHQVVGVTIDLASTKIDLSTVEINDLPNVQVRSGLRQAVAEQTRAS